MPKQNRAVAQTSVKRKALTQKAPPVPAPNISKGNGKPLKNKKKVLKVKENQTMTKRQYFAELRTIVADNADLVAFIDHEVALLDRKNSAPKAPTKKQIANEGLKVRIVDGLGTDPMTATDIVANIFGGETITVQKVSALLAQLVADGSVVKTVEKRVSYFAKA